MEFEFIYMFHYLQILNYTLQHCLIFNIGRIKRYLTPYVHKLFDLYTCSLCRPGNNIIPPSQQNKMYSLYKFTENINTFASKV